VKLKRILMPWLSLFFSLSLFCLPAAGADDKLSGYAFIDNISLSSPTAVALDTTENLYVAQPENDHILIFNNRHEQTGMLMNLAEPISVGVDNTGKIYVGNAERGNVEVYGPGLELLFKLGVGDGEFQQPTAIVVATNGDAYVADSMTNEIKVFQANGVKKFTFGTQGNEAGFLNRPVALAIDAHLDTPQLLVADMPMTTEGGQYGTSHEGARIQFFSMNGQYSKGFGTFGQGSGMLTKVLGVAVDATGRVFITDAFQNIIQAFTADGTFLGVVYDETHPLRTPLGIAIGRESGRIFTASLGTGAVITYGSDTTHAVNATATNNGSITPAGTTNVRHGESQTYTFTPAAGYEVAAVFIDGVNVGALESYTFDRTLADHTLAVEFVPDITAITASAGQHGTITPVGATTVQAGGSMTFSFAPEAGYLVNEMFVDGQAVTPPASGAYSFTNVTADHTIHVNFGQVTYLITKTTGTGGRILPAGTINAGYGSNVGLSIIPDPGYHLKNVLVDTVSQGPVQEYTFTQVQSAHTIQAEFEPNSYRIVVNAQGNGTVSPTGTVDVLYGDDRSFTFVPAGDSEIQDILVDGISVGVGTSFAFDNIKANHTLTALFATPDELPVAQAGPDQNAGEGDEISLNGANSYDPDGSLATYQWTQLDGMPVALVNPRSKNAGFAAPVVNESGQSLSFRLTVTDASGKQTEDDCLVNISWLNQPPVAVAGPNQTVAELQSVKIDSSGSHDPDNESLTYEWHQVAGEAVPLSNSERSAARFTSPALLGEEGSAGIYRVTVKDTGGLRARDYCVVNVSAGNPPPIAAAGPDQSVDGGDEVVLNGGASSDPGNETLSYQWEQTQGYPVTLSGYTMATATFTAPPADVSGQPLTFLLVVTDQAGLVATDKVTITVNQPGAPAAGSARAFMKLQDRNRRNMVYFEFPDGYPVSLINRRTVRLTAVNDVAADLSDAKQRVSWAGDTDQNGISEFAMRIDQEKLTALLPAGTGTITLQGELQNGQTFTQEFAVTIDN